MYNYCTVGMTREQAVTMAKKLGFSEECVDEVTLLMFHPFSGLSIILEHVCNDIVLLCAGC